ncbi:glycosyltransferase [Paeniglutamicibacter cryotolerans]|uniref:glycosyltransferase n=1 Tax=Paeniglutamicibacter cryotolerans TaxID=670079 RepID=UPI0028ADFE24|nr:glycosyltransferase [Paeniglutamicibacter cryotolerans]
MLTYVAYPLQRIAAIVPCYNEEQTIGKVVADLMQAVPGMVVYVFDNASTDETSRVATEAGAVVRHESRKGKGNVLRRAFADIEADVYVTIDGDDTYEARDLPRMIETLIQGTYDHVLGVREDISETTSYRPGHEMGNLLFNRLVSFLFHSHVSDMLSGYRVFSRRFVKSFPAISKEFEIETEITVHVMALRIPQIEEKIGFRGRPPGSESKLNTFSDGLKILRVILQLLRHERPNLYYGIVGSLALILSLGLGLPVVFEFFETGLVPRFPTAIASAALMGISILVSSVGVLLEGVTHARREAARLAYLRLDPPSKTPRQTAMSHGKARAA